MNSRVVALGAGMTGLSAGLSGIPVYEAASDPGGICSSYYMRAGSAERLSAPPRQEDAYRFELGGGHWIFGGDPAVLRLIRSIASVKSYNRRSGVWLAAREVQVPYPIQNHLHYLGPQLATQCLLEITQASTASHKIVTMADWLKSSFGQTLCDLFFMPFHDLYTAGLTHKIAPQDAYKSPVDLNVVIQGAFGSAPAVGYNTTFIYPREGLDVLARRIASSCDIHYRKRALRIDVTEKEIYFSDGSTIPYQTLVSTLPLNKMIEIAGLKTAAVPDPSPSVLVLNIGARKGGRCPEDHWVYVPASRVGFHRVGFYSNVDVVFLPRFAREHGDRVSIYVEKAYAEANKPDPAQVAELSREVVKELQEWGWIGDVDVVDPTWIEVAYTWSRPFSPWKQEALVLLESHDIYQFGRYGRWIFQGIADSIRDGLMAGAAITNADGLGEMSASATGAKTVKALDFRRKLSWQSARVSRHPSR
jgi:protoporphyrinogen oxidase